MNSQLTKNFKPRFQYYSEFELNHPANEPYVDSLVRWGIERINSSAKPYHEKHKGVNNNGAKGKEVSISKLELKKIILDSNCKSPNGVDIYMAPVGVLRAPGQAEKVGLVTSEQRNRFPSFDRIDSTKGYVSGNIQLTTKNYNLGKSNNKILLNEKMEKGNATINFKGIDVSLNEVSSSFLINTLKGLAA